MPVYNGQSVIKETLKSILSQSFSNYEILIADDCSTDNTEKVIKEIKDKRITFYRNSENLGYSKNLEKCRKRARGDIIYLMGQDDILGKDALLNTCKAFERSPEIGAVTRPYYWFDKDINIPVRAKKQLNSKKDELVKITSEKEKILTMFSTLDQLSGLAFRKEYMDLPFHEDIFPCHVYPFASIFKKYTVVFLKDYNLAVRIGSSQARNSKIYGRKTSYIYEKSPIQSWIDMFENVYSEKIFSEFKDWMIKNFVAVNYVGLVQIRNYARYRYLLREIFLLLKYRLQNLFSPIFWFFSLGCLATPSFLLIPLVDWYKNKILSQKLVQIKLDL
ncbi:glycosyltransferase [Patescibacteria group bacterium]|nr:glycosyltransferase [Patescibacteria group bacterium]